METKTQRGRRKWRKGNKEYGVLQSEGGREEEQMEGEKYERNYRKELRKNIWNVQSGEREGEMTFMIQ